MPRLNPIARQARITSHKATVLARLSHRVIDVAKPAYADLYADGIPTKKMTSLNGAIILERDLYPDGRLKGVVSVDVDDLAALLPDLKADTTDKMGWKKHLDKLRAEGVDLLAGVPSPQPGDYDSTAMEDLLTLNPDTMTATAAHQALKDIVAKAKAGNL